MKLHGLEFARLIKRPLDKRIISLGTNCYANSEYYVETGNDMSLSRFPQVHFNLLRCRVVELLVHSFSYPLVLFPAQPRVLLFASSRVYFYAKNCI